MKTTKHYDQPGKWEVMVGEGEWMGIVDAREGGEYKLRVVVEHKHKNVESRAVVRAVAGKGARINLSGLIKIAKEAQGTDSFLELRVLILDSKSMATVDPQLEIEANQVKAGHAGSVTRIDEEQVQYLMSRGLERKQAEEEIVEGWLAQE